MKALGMTVIVYGHATRAVPLVPPIYLKQLGVALFLFATGFTLARETRPSVEALVKRLFQLWIFGFVCAAAITVAGAVNGTGLALSNFLPLAGGANVVFDNFPANPTTWYLGTYLHLLLVWAVWLRRVRVRTWMVVAAVAIEIPVRALLIGVAGRYVAYMLLTNWAAVFLLGLARGAEESDQLTGSPVPFVIAGIGGFALWGAAMQRLPFELTIPFMTLRGWPPAIGAAVVSAGVSAAYLGGATVVFEATRRMEAPAVVRFVARNTAIIFLAHMPIVLALHPVLLAWHVSYPARVAIQLAIGVFGLAAVSEAIWLITPRVDIHSLPAAMRGRRAVASASKLVGITR
jgi:Acyltransferase family